MTDDDQTTNGGTTETAYRWKYLSTALTLWIAGGYVALVLGQAFGVTDAPPGNGTWATFSLAFIAVLAYAVGTDTLKAAREARK